MHDKPAFISTPARMIIMEYNSSAPLSDIEIRALEKYSELHSQYQPLLNSWKTLQADYQALVKPQRQIQHELFSLREEVKKYRQLAGFTPEEIAQMPEPDEELELQPNKLHQQAEKLEDDFEVYYKRFQELIGRFKEANNGNEIMEKLYDDFDNNYFGHIMKHHEKMEINVVRLDEDYNEFNILMDELSNHIYGAADEHKAMLTAHNEIVGAMDDILRRIDKIYEEVDKLRADNIDGAEPGLN